MMVGARSRPAKSAREDILDRLKRQARTATHPQPWRSRRQFADLAQEFDNALSAVSGEVHLVDSWAEALQHVSLSLREVSARKVLVDNHPILAEMDLVQHWPDIEWYRVGHSPGNLRDFAATADVGISGADAALAETGSVVVSSGPGQSRLTSLMPPTHIALVPYSCLYTDLISWMAHQKSPQPTSITLISGPSKTADIEQTLAVGVHGPGRFIAILYMDNEE